MLRNIIKAYKRFFDFEKTKTFEEAIKEQKEQKEQFNSLELLAEKEIPVIFDIIGKEYIYSLTRDVKNKFNLEVNKNNFKDFFKYLEEDEVIEFCINDIKSIYTLKEDGTKMIRVSSDKGAIEKYCDEFRLVWKQDQFRKHIFHLTKSDGTIVETTNIYAKKQ